MAQAVPPRREIPHEHTWAVESVFPDRAAWEQGVRDVQEKIGGLARYQGTLGNGPRALLDWFTAVEDLYALLGRVYLYGSMQHAVDTGDQEAKALYDRGSALFAQAVAASAFADPEMIAIGFDTLRKWMDENPPLAVYRHYVDRLEQRQAHVRSAEVEELLGSVQDPFSTAASTHRVLTDTDLSFRPAVSSSGQELSVAQGNLGALLSDADRETRRTAWESYSDAHLAMKNTMANNLAAGMKQDVFMARARRYASSLEASLQPNHIPVEVFYTLIDTFKKHLPTWHKYWAIRREALGYDVLYPWDIKAPLADAPHVPYAQAVEWIVEGMRPLGDEYVTTLRRGATADRWVDIYPNERKTSGAFSSGFKGTRPFILMSYTDDIYSMSTLAHELGHSMHSYFAWKNQPFAYAWYGLFVAEVASNFNQAMVRAHLMQAQDDPAFQIALIEEAMSNFHRYFFIMPTLARFELELHERAERGETLPADAMIALMADLFGEGYGDEVQFDRDRVGITWAQFSGHLYAKFYVFQYATGISAAHALAHGVLEGGSEAAERYIQFLSAGGSRYPLDVLRMAGVDMTSPEPVERTFGILSDMVDRLGELVRNTG